MSHTVTITEAHRRLIDLVSEVEETGRPIFLTDAGEEKAALLSMQSYRRLLSVAEREIRRQQALTVTPTALEAEWQAGFAELEALGVAHFSGVSEETLQDFIRRLQCPMCGGRSHRQYVSGLCSGSRGRLSGE